MTVTYSQKISTTSFCLFTRLLLRWRGSVFKLIWRDIVFYLIVYGSCSTAYRYFMTEQQKRIFEKVALLCESFRSAAPISFILGFYVSIVITRWWEQYMLIPWPDDMCILVASYVQGKDARSKSLRRGIARYINLAFVLTFTRISARVVKVFPNYDRLVKREYLTPKEKNIMEMVDELNNHQQVWDPLPLLWASMVVIKARKEGYIPDDHSQEALIHEITNLRYSCSKLQEYCHMSVPLVYTQVTTMATYTYFMCSVMSHQYLDPDQGYKDHLIDIYVPVFTILQFIFYMGWLKVAESLLNPFGDDDDDFDTSDLLERHLEVSYLIVDDMHRMEPHLLQDLTDEAGGRQSKQNDNKKPDHQDYESFQPFQNPTDHILKTKSEPEETTLFNTTTTAIDIDTLEPPVYRNSPESFCSIATAIPKSDRRSRSNSITSHSSSSSDCKYNSCYSLIRQNSNNNTTETSTYSTTQSRKRTNGTKSATFEQVRLTTVIY